LYRAAIAVIIRVYSVSQELCSDHRLGRRPTDILVGDCQTNKPWKMEVLTIVIGGIVSFMSKWKICKEYQTYFLERHHTILSVLQADRQPKRTNLVVEYSGWPVKRAIFNELKSNKS
jgi:hypothetical protein